MLLQHDGTFREMRSHLAIREFPASRQLKKLSIFVALEFDVEASV